MQLQYLVWTPWAIAFSAGIGTTSETNEPGSAAAPGSPDFEYSQSSWQVRLGAGFMRDGHPGRGPDRDDPAQRIQ